MAESSSSKPTSLTGAKRKIKVRKCPSSVSSNSTSDEEEIDNYLPPAARDSKWVGLTFYNPNFEKQIGDEINDEGEIRLTAVDEEEELPIYSLFPKLREKYRHRTLQTLSMSEDSTTDITKSLVGQTPNFTHMKKSSKLLPMKTSLPSLKEISNEDDTQDQHINNPSIASSLKNKSNANTANKTSERKSLKPVSEPSVSYTSKEHYEEEDSDSSTTTTPRKKKRTKRRSDTSHKNVESGSSYSGLNRPLNKSKENVIKPKRNVSKEQKTITQHSSQGSLADEESV